MNTATQIVEHVTPWCPNCEDRDPHCTACAGEGYARAGSPPSSVNPCPICRRTDHVLCAATEREQRLAADLLQAECAVRELLEVTEHGSNSGPVFQARVTAYSFLRRPPL